MRARHSQHTTLSVGCPLITRSFEATDCHWVVTETFS